MEKNTAAGQVATEYLILIGILLTALGIMAGYALTTYYETMRIHQATNAVETLASAADQVYALGQGNSTTVPISLPAGITESHVVGNEIYVVLEAFGTTGDIVAETKGPVSGTLPTAEGTYRISVAVVDENVVLSEV